MRFYHLENELRPLGRLVIPTIVFLVPLLAVISPVSPVCQLASGVIAENIAIRSLWLTLALSALVAGIILLSTRKLARTGPSWTWELLRGPRDLIQGWATTLAAISAATGLIYFVVGVFFLAFDVLLVCIGLLAVAATVAYMLDWLDDPVPSYMNASYDPSDPRHRRNRATATMMSFAVALVALWATFTAESPPSSFCTQPNESAAGNVQPAPPPAPGALSAGRTPA